jgi:hypothetical protein
MSVKKVDQKITEIREVIDKINCDRCGKLLYERDQDQPNLNSPTPPENREPSAVLPAEFTYSGQYNTDFDEDWQASLCDSCALAVFDFINADEGEGVHVDEFWGGVYPDADNQDVAWAPFDAEKFEYAGKSSCKYHDSKLVLTQSAVACSVKGCPFKFEYVYKSDLKRKN